MEPELDAERLHHSDEAARHDGDYTFALSGGASAMQGRLGLATSQRPVKSRCVERSGRVARMMRGLLLALPIVVPSKLCADDKRVPFANCHPVPRADRCECWLSSVASPLTFAQASGLIERYYRADPDPIYEEALTKLLRDCVFGWSRGEEAAMPTVRLTQDGQIADISR